jgi:hypothetical protein
MERRYVKYYLQQTGGGYSEIGSFYNAPISYQRGRGLGNLFGGLFKYLQPVLSSGFNLLTNELASTGVDALKDIMSGANVKEVIQDRGKEAYKNMRKNAVNQLHKMYGSGIRTKHLKRRTFLKRRGIKRKRSTLRSQLTKRRRKKRTKSSKKRVLDIFG